MTVAEKQRQPNRIEGYDYSQQGAYFVTICTQDRKKLLSDIVGDGFPVPKLCGRIAEAVIKEIPQKYPGVNVHKYVIMPDHIHMLLMIRNSEQGTGNPSPTLGNVIGWYKYQATKRINLLLKTPGESVFQRSYYDHVVRNQQDYNEIWEYIAYNPTKWAIEKQGRD